MRDMFHKSNELLILLTSDQYYVFHLLLSTPRFQSEMRQKFKA